MVSSLGIIPADAGSTHPIRNHRRHVQDHPRGCGEHPLDDSWRIGESGSSPRMRGARFFAHSSLAMMRIIPADAGSTPRWAARSRPCTDHPRGCGEHHDTDVLVPKILGSSPRMRGARSLLNTSVIRAGIIPADAGSTKFRIRIWLLPRDHPRGCGEHKARDRPDTLSPGSSPRMRGARRKQYESGRRGRIIPADAGSTQQQQQEKGQGVDHPRGCGEHLLLLALVAVLVGSSPRMRGAPRTTATTAG